MPASWAILRDSEASKKSNGCQHVGMVSLSKDAVAEREKENGAGYLSAGGTATKEIFVSRLALSHLL